MEMGSFKGGALSVVDGVPLSFSPFSLVAAVASPITPDSVMALHHSPPHTKGLSASGPAPFSASCLEVKRPPRGSGDISIQRPVLHIKLRNRVEGWAKSRPNSDSLWALVFIFLRRRQLLLDRALSAFA